jgi:hypothetical protein
MRTYEPPTLHEVGSFTELTGLLPVGKPGDTLAPLLPNFLI